MPTKIRRLTRGPEPTLSDSLRRFLETGAREPGDRVTFRLSGSPERLREVWRKVRREIMTSWLKACPASRPWCWWECDAPTEPVLGWPTFHAAQRLRLGGVGDPEHDHLAVVPRFSFGIPDAWIGPDHVAAGFDGTPVDAADPPVFEGQAEFLRRHDLLSESERRHLEIHPELLAPEAIVFDDDDGET